MSALPTLLGIRPGMRVSLLQAPEGFLERLNPLPQGVALVDSSRTGLDVTLFFTTRKTELVEKLPALARAMAVTGHVWVCFPTASDGCQVPDETYVRRAGLEIGLVDDKRLQLDPAWVGLRLSWKPRAPRLEKPQIQA